MNMLRKIWEKQTEQQRDFNMDPSAMSDVAKLLAAKDLLLGLQEEVAKLSSNSTHYKAHLLKFPPINKVNVADAVVDVVKYAIAIAQLYGVGVEEFFDAFMRKTEVVGDKARGERITLERNTPVVVLDIDNVLADLTVWDEELSKVQGRNDKVIETMESMKTEFYLEGGFARLNTIPGAPQGVKELISYGWKIVLVSARPYWQYRRIYADTVMWLKEKEIKYDLLLFNNNKAEAIYEFIFPAMPSFLVEDRKKHVLEVSELGVRVLLMDYPYNRNVEESKLVTRVNSWEEIVEIIGRP